MDWGTAREELRRKVRRGPQQMGEQDRALALAYEWLSSLDLPEGIRHLEFPLPAGVRRLSPGFVFPGEFGAPQMPYISSATDNPRLCLDSGTVVRELTPGSAGVSWSGSGDPENYRILSGGFFEVDRSPTTDMKIVGSFILKTVPLDVIYDSSSSSYIVRSPGFGDISDSYTDWLIHGYLDLLTWRAAFDFYSSVNDPEREVALGQYERKLREIRSDRNNRTIPQIEPWCINTKM